MPQASASMLVPLAKFIGLLLTVYMWIVIIRAVISWVNPNPYNPVVKFLARITDPVLLQIRRIVPIYYGGIDFSPVILILLLVFLNDFAVNALILIAVGRPFSSIPPLFAISLVRLVQGFLFAYMIVLIVRAVMSWISPDPYNPIVQFVYGVTEPVLHPLRRSLPLALGGLDLAPLLIIAAIYFINTLLDRAMAMLSMYL